MTEYTLKQLKTMKQEWIKSAIATGLLQDLKNAVVELGVSINDQYRYPYCNRDNIKRIIIEDNIELTVFLDMGKKAGDGWEEERDVLTIAVNKHLVCWYAFTNMPYPDDDPFFVPGKWQEKVKPFCKSANELISNRIAIAEQEKRKALERQLLIGIEI